MMEEGETKELCLHDNDDTKKCVSFRGQRIMSIIKTDLLSDEFGTAFANASTY
jgi:hypothetical protein